MAVINSCLKRVFVAFCILLGVGGLILLGLGILASVNSSGVEQLMSGVLCLYSTAGFSLILSIFGIYGALKEKKWALIVFFVGMVLGGLGLLHSAMRVSVGMPMAIQAIDRLFGESIPLDEASSEVQMILNKVQPQLKCCGAFNGYQDWGKHVPDSCSCSSVSEQCEKMNSTQSVSDNGRSPDALFDGSGKLVYKQPCVPILTALMQKALNTVLIVCIIFGVLAIAGMVMSMTMICKIRRSGTPVTYTQFQNA